MTKESRLAEIFAAIPEPELCRLAHELALGLDCPVPLANYVEAASNLISVLDAHDSESRSYTPDECSKIVEALGGPASNYPTASEMAWVMRQVREKYGMTKNQELAGIEITSEMSVAGAWVLDAFGEARGLYLSLESWKEIAASVYMAMAHRSPVYKP